MYLPDDSFESVVDDLIRLLRPGGRLAAVRAGLWGEHPRARKRKREPSSSRFTTLCSSHFPNRWAPGGYPELLAARGLHHVTGTPFPFALDETVWRRIVSDTLTAGAPLDPEITAWLDEQAAAAARGEFVTATHRQTTAAIRPGRPGPAATQVANSPPARPARVSCSHRVR